MREAYAQKLVGILLHGNFAISSLSHLLIYSNHLSTSLWTHGYLFCTSNYNPSYVTYLVPALTIRSNFSWLLASFDMLLSLFMCLSVCVSECMCVCVLSYLLSLQEAAGSFCVFLVPVQESAISVRSLASFIREQY